MKILLIILSLFFQSGVKETEATSFIASSYIVMERHQREVLEGQNIHEVRSVASISKVMTAIIALESERIFDVVTATEEAIKQEGSSIYLKLGDKLTLLDLVYGLLLRSGNDAAYLIANYLGPGLPEFVSKMNEKARSIGMKNSTFNNPSGLDIDDEGNLSTAYDMALLFSYSMENELFRRIVNTSSYSSKYGVFQNKNRLLKSYPNCEGGKTGYTLKAKRTLVTGAKKDDTLLTVVTLNCGNDFNFHKALYEKHFAKNAYVAFLTKGVNQIGGYRVYAKKEYGIILNKKEVNSKTIKLYRFDEEGVLHEMMVVLNDGRKVVIAYE